MLCRPSRRVLKNGDTSTIGLPRFRQSERSITILEGHAVRTQGIPRSGLSGQAAQLSAGAARHRAAVCEEGRRRAPRTGPANLACGRYFGTDALYTRASTKSRDADRSCRSRDSAKSPSLLKRAICPLPLFRRMRYNDRESSRSVRSLLGLDERIRQLRAVLRPGIPAFHG
jgi:hypothetical protein